LRRAMVTDDAFAFAYVRSEAALWASKIYDAYWAALGGALDTPANRAKLNEVRLRYGNKFTD